MPTRSGLKLRASLAAQLHTRGFRASGVKAPPSLAAPFGLACSLQCSPASKGVAKNGAGTGKFFPAESPSENFLRPRPAARCARRPLQPAGRSADFHYKKLCD